MKPLFKLSALAIVPVLFAVSCESFDPSSLEADIDALQEKTESLENRYKEMEEAIKALQNAANGGDYITSITPIKEGNEVIGYTITFAKADPISIYNGEDGAQGDKGDKGDKGDTGDKGDKGDKGDTGDAGTGSGTCLIASIDLSQPGYATITLASGEKFTIVVKLDMTIEFDLSSDSVLSNAEFEIPYTVKGVEEATVVAIAQGDWKAAAVAATATTGKIIVKSGTGFNYDLAVLVYSCGQTLMRTIHFDKGEFSIADANKNVSVGAEGGNVAVTVSTNLALTATCEAAWVSVVETKSAVADVNVNLVVAANTGAERSAEIKLFSDGIYLESVTLTQEAPKPVSITVDGDFSDWNNAAIATMTLQEGAALTVLKTAKFAADEKYLYIYMEIDKTKQFGSVADFNVMMDIYIDNDGNPATGGIRSDVFNHGVNWYYETFLGDEATGFTTWNSGQYEYNGADGGSIWSLSNHGGEYTVATAGVYDAENDFARVEARLSRTDFKLTNTKAAFGIVLMDGTEAWAPMGKLPQNDDLSMFVVDLPAYVADPAPEVKGITIDGDFSDWNDESIAGATLQEGAALKVLKTVKYTADDKFLYVYIKIADIKANNSAGDLFTMMDLYIDNDGDPATGGIRSDVFNHGVNWYYECFLCDENNIGTWNAGQYEYNGADGGSIWSLTNHGGEYPVLTNGKYEADIDGFEIEARLSRADFKLTNTKAAFGMVVMEGNTGGWPAMGKLPQNDDLSMLVVDLPAYSAE